MWLLNNMNVVVPKILVLDIETAPAELYAWSLYEKYSTIDKIKEDWFVICWSAKWLLETNVMNECLTSQEILKKDDQRIIKVMWSLLNDADIVITHNWDKFDLRKLNTRFIKYNLRHPSPYRTIDTLKIVRKHFSPLSNKLDYWCKFLWIPAKLETGWFQLWKDCLQWVQSSLRKMSKYCSNDVIILEKLYYKLRPYITNHPNLSVYLQQHGRCGNCWWKTLDLVWYSYTNQHKYRVFRCSCGALNKENKIYK